MVPVYSRAIITCAGAGPDGGRGAEEKEDGHQAGQQEGVLHGVPGSRADLSGRQVWAHSRAVW